ncbi:MAG: hypothetical protein AAF936_13150 [Pseudomonadota bacterium]
MRAGTSIGDDKTHRDIVEVKASTSIIFNRFQSYPNRRDAADIHKQTGQTNKVMCYWFDRLARFDFEIGANSICIDLIEWIKYT